MMNGDESQLMIKVDLDDSCWNGVTNRLTNGRTDNAISRVAFATEKSDIA